ncbi:MAG: cyanophycinase [Xanthomonadales bacterium]|nr:cyanophycinase [Xanthomonadales bacterium]
MCPAKVAPDAQRGHLIPIGGAEDKVGDIGVLKRFIRLCPKRPAIAIVPTASRLEETGRVYQDLFRDLGASQAQILSFADRGDCEDPTQLALIEQADAVFITGGNQLRLSTTLGGTSVAKLLRRRNAEGMPIAGTSAGAAIMPEHMIAGGEEGAAPRAGMVSLAPGLGLTNKVMVDQHFRQRDRLGRLISALSLNPFAVALGIDEDTAAFIDGDNMLEVVGSGTVTILDPADLGHSSMPDAGSGEVLSVTNIRLHVLAAGGRFDLDARSAHAPPDQD